MHCFKTYEWIEYSSNYNFLFCFACYHLSSGDLGAGETAGKTAFIKTEFFLRVLVC